MDPIKREKAVALAEELSKIWKRYPVAADIPMAIAREFRAAIRLPIVIQSNAGLPEYREGRIHYPESPEFFARHAPALLQAGVFILGGCCGSTPAHIDSIKKVIDQIRK